MASLRGVLVLGCVVNAGPSLAGVPVPAAVVHPVLFNATTNDPAVDQPPGLGTNFSVSSAHNGSDTPEDAFGNEDGAVEPGTFIFGEGGTADNGNETLGDGGETVDFIEWQTTQPVTVLGYQLTLTQFDPFGRQTELVRFLVDGVERDFFDNDSATGIDNATVNQIPRPFGAFVTGSTFRIELTRASNGPRITEIDALTESFCGNGSVEGGEQCDDGNAISGDGCDDACQSEPGCPSTRPTGCLSAAKAGLSVQEKKAGREKLAAKLGGFGAPTSQGDLGSPVSGSTRYDVCLYGPDDSLVADLVVDEAGETCGAKAKPCWKDKGGRGWLYKDPEADASGVRKLTAASGAAGKGKLQIQAGNNERRGQDELPTGIAAALQGAGAVAVQVRTSDALCFEASLSTVKKNDGVQFKAKAP
jgi:cysteine-rich repeat protein